MSVPQQNGNQLKLLSDHRKDRGLTIKELADSARLSQPTIYKIEKGTHCPNESTVQQLADTLGISEKEIYLPRGKTNLGKPAHGGGRSGVSSDKHHGKLCGSCFIKKSLTGDCYCTI